MSENYGKHLFEIREGWAWFRGTVERETEQTWFFRGGRRALKSKGDFLLPADIDPEAATQAYRSRYRDFDEAIAEAKKALAKIQRTARLCAADAMRAAPKSPKS